MMNRIDGPAAKRNAPSGASRAMRTPRTFTTRTLPPDVQFDAWRTLHRSLFDLELVDRNTTAYMADHKAWDLGGLTLTRASMPNAARRSTHWDRPETDDWMLEISSSGARGRFNPGSTRMGFRSLGRPFQAVFRETEALSVFLPRDLLREQADVLDRAPLCPPPGILGPLITDFLITMEAKLPVVSEDELASLVQASCSLIIAFVDFRQDNVENAKSALYRATVIKARRLIRQNLGNRGLDPAMLARSLGISRSALYRAFEVHGGIVAFIQQERLDEAHHRLANATARLNIGTLAGELGFVDHSSFTRAFKRRFGYSPRDVLAPGIDSGIMAIGVDRRSEPSGVQITG